MYAPPQMPTEATNRTRRTAMGQGTRNPLAGPRLGHSSCSPSNRESKSDGGTEASRDGAAGISAVVSTRNSPVGGPLLTMAV